MHVVARTALGLCLGGLLAGGASAQEQSLDGLLASLNQRLQQNSYRDYDGKHTTSQVRLPGDGSIVVEITKQMAENEVTNVYVASVRELDLTRIAARQREDHTSLSLGAQGQVSVTLRCVTRGGPTHEWGLPATRELVVEFRADPALASELTQEFRELIRRARRQSTG